MERVSEERLREICTERYLETPPHHEVVAIARELLELREECIEHLSTILREGVLHGGGKYQGWYDSMALSHINNAGDRLVELGVCENMDTGGKRQFYRFKEPTP